MLIPYFKSSWNLIGIGHQIAFKLQDQLVGCGITYGDKVGKMKNLRKYSGRDVCMFDDYSFGFCFTQTNDK